MSHPSPPLPQTASPPPLSPSPAAAATAAADASKGISAALHALIATAGRPAEAVALLRYRRKATRARAAMLAELRARGTTTTTTTTAAAAAAAATTTTTTTRHTATGAPWDYVYEALTNVSRSFALVIVELQPALRHPVAVFYLVLRALDTVEDDTAADPALRADLCRRFHTLLLPPHPAATTTTTGDAAPEKNLACWQLSSQFGAGHEKTLLERFPDVLACYAELEPAYRDVIRDITRRMGHGMAEHIRDVECVTLHDYDLYCHYVAGLVGEGLSAMFAASGAEEDAFRARTRLSNSMGLFLQKTNIIRDYLEDAIDGRTFWPHEIWSNYSASLADFASPSNRKAAMPALNHMVTDALRHVPDCLEYMSHVRNQNVFNFVAIPQVMAIATLAECFNNGEVFERKVKIRRSLTAALVLRTRNMDALYKLFFDSAVRMLHSVEPSDPSADATREQLNGIIDICAPHVPPTPDLVIPNLFSIVAFCGLSSYMLKRRAEHDDGAIFTWRSAGGIMEFKDMLAVALLFMVCIYLFSFFMLPYLTRAQLEEVRRIEQAKRTAERRQRLEEASIQPVTRFIDG